MIEILGIIVIVDGLKELLVNEVLCSFAVSGFERMQKRAAVGLFYPLFKPVGNGVFIYRCNFDVGIFISSFRLLPSFCSRPFQIASKEQEVPKIILVTDEYRRR